MYFLIIIFLVSKFAYFQVLLCSGRSWLFKYCDFAIEKTLDCLYSSGECICGSISESTVNPLDFSVDRIPLSHGGVFFIDNAIFFAWISSSNVFQIHKAIIHN